MTCTNELFDLKGQVAVVIGGGGVLAGAMALGLAKAGSAIAILDLSEEKAQAMADQCAATGVRSLAIALNATSKTALQEAQERIQKELGPPTVLINAPGINSSTPFFDIGEDEFERILQVNLKSMFLACQVFGQKMVEKGLPASIINISSASSGPPLSRVFTYSVSKAGVNNLTMFLAREWATKGVRVNAIAPGFFPAEQNRKILTPERVADIMKHTPMNRFGEAEELVGATIWLASPRASSFVTGAIIRVDGGFTAMTI
jgi:NAD(P)-dependent dehydrogenase (short-subunit alcohol dehydrogenase family)